MARTASEIGRSNVRRGKTYERRVAKLMTEWSGTKFRRRRVEGREDNVIYRDSTADVIPASGAIIFSIEVKCGILHNFDGLLANPKTNKFTVWWHQCCYDALLSTEAAGTTIWPMLFFKPHKNFDWVAVARHPFDTGIIKPRNGGNYSSLWFPGFAVNIYELINPVTHNVSRSTSNPVMKSIDLHPCYMMRWKDFADNVDPNSILLEP